MENNPKRKVVDDLLAAGGNASAMVIGEIILAEDSSKNVVPVSAEKAGEMHSLRDTREALAGLAAMQTVQGLLMRFNSEDQESDAQIRRIEEAMPYCASGEERKELEEQKRTWLLKKANDSSKVRGALYAAMPTSHQVEQIFAQQRFLNALA